ncbi:MAG: hypothetical protein ACP5NV_05375 [Candidatus Woesearchaeota archaeon]
MLNNDVIKKIESFVHSKPRSVDEVAKHVGKNWRTADRYISEIEKEYSTISTRVFREGSRGALKIVFWSSMEKASSTVFQEMLEEELMHNKNKEDFSAFDIFQYVSDKNKTARIETAKQESYTQLKEFADILSSTKKELIIFSGNLSFINLRHKNVDLYSVMDNLVKRGVRIRIICRTDFSGAENIERMLALNFKYGKDAIEIRHREQPLRANIIDGKLIRIKEIRKSTGKIRELNTQIFIFYTIRDSEWASWLSRVFWKMFSSSIDARKRLDELKKIR